MNKKIYWKIRNFFKNAIFFVKKIFFKANRRAFEEKKHSNHFEYIIKEIVIKRPERKIKKRPLFTFLDEEESE